MYKSTKRTSLFVLVALLVLSLSTLSYASYHDTASFDGSLKKSLTTGNGIFLEQGPCVVELEYYPRTKATMHVTICKPDGTEVETQDVTWDELQTWQSKTLTFYVSSMENYHIKFSFDSWQSSFWKVKGKFYDEANN
ncbi:hypothetical protein [Wukongibacter sp. M2B1]|uniref:hypothetical protein n=1 Tax=Wukongibacter sp. M2B1 TaxID=3088895 RepID=UPI003D79415C